MILDEPEWGMKACTRQAHYSAIPRTGRSMTSRLFQGQVFGPVRHILRRYTDIRQTPPAGRHRGIQTKTETIRNRTCRPGLPASCPISVSSQLTALDRTLTAVCCSSSPGVSTWESHAERDRQSRGTDSQSYSRSRPTRRCRGRLCRNQRLLDGPEAALMSGILPGCEFQSSINSKLIP